MTPATRFRRGLGARVDVDSKQGPRPPRPARCTSGEQRLESDLGRLAAHSEHARRFAPQFTCACHLGWVHKVFALSSRHHFHVVMPSTTRLHIPSANQYVPTAVHTRSPLGTTQSVRRVLIDCATHSKRGAAVANGHSARLFTCRQQTLHTERTFTQHRRASWSALACPSRPQRTQP